LLSPHREHAAPCLIVTFTGTSDPPPFNGLAGPGTLVRYGDDTNNCRAVLTQFDAGRGTLMRLSQVGVQAAQLNAVFFTHIHSEYAEGFSDIAQQRWLFASKGPKLDVVCSTDAKSSFGFFVSCSEFVAHIDDAYQQLSPSVRPGPRSSSQAADDEHNHAWLG
jgi:ribonuclease Z